MKQLLISFTALLLWACSNKDDKVSCSNDILPKDDIEVEFNILGKSFISGIRILKYDINENATGIEYAYCKPNEDLFLLVQYYCSINNIIIYNKLMGVVLYYDLPISNSLKVEDTNIKGISLYLVNGNNVTHHLFTKNEKYKFCEVENVSIAVSGISFNQIHFYLENYVFQDPKNKSFIIFDGELMQEVCKNRNKYRVPFKFEVKPEKSFNYK